MGKVVINQLAHDVRIYYRHRWSRLKQIPWCLKSWTATKYMEQNFREFLEINDNGEVSDSTLWETLKVTMRGYIISFEAIV